MIMVMVMVMIMIMIMIMVSLHPREDICGVLELSVFVIV